MFYSDDLDSRLTGSKSFGDPRKGPPSANTNHNYIYSASGILPNFDRSSFAVRTRISLIVELLREPGIRKGSAQFNNFVDRSSHTLITRCEENLCSKTLQEETTFYINCIGHSQDA